MVICQSVFGALCTIKHTDLELYNAAISSFDMTGYIRIGSYQRDLITYHGGKSVCLHISIIRVRIKGNMSRHTHAILPDILVPYSSYSIRFILSVIYLFNHRNCTSSALADRLFLSRSTINTWLRLYADHISKWLGSLKEADRKLCDIESAATSVPDFLRLFLSETGHPFLMRSDKLSHVIADQPPAPAT